MVVTEWFHSFVCKHTLCSAVDGIQSQTNHSGKMPGQLCLHPLLVSLCKAPQGVLTGPHVGLYRLALSVTPSLSNL
jgi:hypothetical protein